MARYENQQRYSESDSDRRGRNEGLVYRIKRDVRSWFENDDGDDRYEIRNYELRNRAGEPFRFERGRQYGGYETPENTYRDWHHRDDCGRQEYGDGGEHV